MVDGVAFEVTRARDFDRDVLLAAGNGGAAAERAALVKQLEQVERQIARRRHERVAGMVRATRTERTSSPNLGARSGAEPGGSGGSSPSGTFRFRFRTTELDLTRELDALADDDVARAVEILRAERRR